MLRGLITGLTGCTQAVISCLRGEGLEVDQSLDSARLLESLAHFAIPDELYPWSLLVIKNSKDELEQGSVEARAQAADIMSQLRALLSARPRSKAIRVTASTTSQNGVVKSISLSCDVYLYKRPDCSEAWTCTAVPYLS